MSSSDTKFSRRAALLSLAALPACGFEPVYAPSGCGQSLVGTIALDPPLDRQGFLLNQRIEERLGRADLPRYRLATNVTIRKDGLANTRDGQTTRFNLIGTAAFALSDPTTASILTQGAVNNFSGYSTTGSTVATLAAERDAQARLMILLADQIVTRLEAAAGTFPA